MDELTQLELMALVGEQQIMLARMNKTNKRLTEEIAALKKSVATTDSEN